MIDAQNLISVHWCQIESQSFGWSTKEQLYWFYRQKGTQLAHCALQKLCFNLEEFGEELHRNGSRVGLLLMTRMYAGPAFLNLASSGLLLNFCGIYNLSSLGLLIISWWLNWGIASSSSYHLPFVERVSCLVSWLTVIFYQDLCLNTCQFRSVPTLCDPMNRSMPGLPVHHQLLEFTQTHVHWVGDATQPSHPLSSPSPPALNLSQHQGPLYMSIELVMPPSHLILCHPFFLLPSIFPSIRVFSNESALCIGWPKYWSFSFNISPSNEHPGLITTCISQLKKFIYILAPPLPLWSSSSELSERLSPGL